MTDHDRDKRFLGVGDSLPAISLPDLDGSLTALSASDSGKFILFMWASW